MKALLTLFFCFFEPNKEKRPPSEEGKPHDFYLLFLYSMAAWIRPSNKGCGRSGLDLNSG